MPDSPEITYAPGLEELTGALEGLERPGDYVASGTVVCAPPLMEVDGVGVVSFPVPTEQARALAAAAERAPYGRGDQTLVDESVRKVRQISPDKVKISGKQWPSTLASIVATTTEGLGCPKGSLKADLYKVLVYETGGFFLPHRDTEKAPGMLGTLIVVLPSAHEGGELIVRHDSRERALDLRNLDPGELRYAAFYADCEHEVRPVSAGHRICLIYNLVMTSRAKGESAVVPDTRPHVENAARALSDWRRQRPEGGAKLVYLLQHRYTEATLSFATLKGPDAARAQVLCAAAEAAGLVAHLGMVHIEESGWAEYYGGYGRSRRRWSRWEESDDEESDDDDFEIGEVCDEHRFIDQWRDSGDTPVDYGEIPLEEEEVLPAGALDNEPPDKTHFSEATGNEGASFERTYLRAAVVLWAMEDFDLICASAGEDAALTRLEQRAEQARPGDAEAATAIRKIVAFAEENWPDYLWSEKLCARLLNALVRPGNPDLLQIAPLSRLAGAYSSAFNPALRRWAELVGPGAFASVLQTLVVSNQEGRNPFSRMELWCELAELWQDRADARPPLRDLLANTMPFLQDPDEEDEDPGYGFFPRKEPEACSPELLARFLHHLEDWPDEKEREAFSNLATTSGKAFPPDDLILPAIECIAEGDFAIRPATANKLWQHCAEWVLARSATPPAPPENWTLPLTERQLKGLRADLKAFALDPDQKEMRFRVRKALRQEIHLIIDSRKLDMTHVTERRGSPYTLVCTKTLDHYDRACQQYKKDVSTMKRLLQLPAAQSSVNSDTATRLAAALGQ